MKKKIYLTFLSILLLTGSCKKYSETNLEGVQISEKQLDHRQGPNLQSEAEILDEFDDALGDASTATFSDISSSSYQLTSAYINLSNASVDLLDEAGILDSVKFHLNITSNADPKLILAAKLINEMVMFPPPIDTLSSAMPGWVNCMVEAGIGISIETLKNLTAGGTLWHVGQAIKHMGYKWLAKTVGKTMTKFMTGFGGVLLVADFALCMVTAYGDVDILDMGMEPSINSIPVSFYNTNKKYWDYYKDRFMTYMLTYAPGWDSNDYELIYNYTYESQGDPLYMGTEIVRDFFLSISNEEPPIIDN